jgi:hypothetical protein
MRSAKLQVAVVSAILVLTTVACSPMTDNSLLTDKKDDSSSLTVDKTPKAEELYLKLNTSNIGVAVTGTKLEVGGECYLSTYTNHRIIVRENSSVIPITDITSATTTEVNTAKCRNGKFNFSMNIGVFASGSHSVRVSLQAIDGLGALVTNEAQGAATLTFTK